MPFPRHCEEWHLIPQLNNILTGSVSDWCIAHWVQVSNRLCMSVCKLHLLYNYIVHIWACIKCIVSKQINEWLLLLWLCHKFYINFKHQQLTQLNSFFWPGWFSIWFFNTTCKELSEYTFGSSLTFLEVLQKWILKT